MFQQRLFAPYDGFEVKVVDEDERTVRLTFWSYVGDAGGREDKGWLELTVDENGRVLKAGLSTGTAVPPTAISRFPWARWVTAAETVLRQHGLEPPLVQLEDGTFEEGPAALRVAEMLPAIIEALREMPPRPAKPGRRGIPTDFYEAIATRYSAHVAAGKRHPVQAITDEETAAGRPVSRGTVASWVRRARQLGLLPPAKRGRAG